MLNQSIPVGAAITLVAAEASELTVVLDRDGLEVVSG